MRTPPRCLRCSHEFNTDDVARSTRRLHTSGLGGIRYLASSSGKHYCNSLYCALGTTSTEQSTQVSRQHDEIIPKLRGKTCLTGMGHISLQSLLQWFLLLAIPLRCGPRTLLRSMISDPEVWTGTVLWPAPLLATLHFGWKGDIWVLSRTRAKRFSYFCGVKLCTEACDLSEASRMELCVADVPSILSINQVSETQADFLGGTCRLPWRKKTFR